MSVASMCVHTIYAIQTETVSKDSLGDGIRTWNTRLSNIVCQRGRLNSEAIIAYGRLGYTATDKVIFPIDYSITIQDRFQFDEGGQYYYVRQVDHFQQGSIEYWRAVVDATRG